MFLFYLENVILLGKEPHEKSLALLAYLDGDAFRFFFDRFTDAGELTEESRDFAIVKRAFLEKFEEKD